MSRHRYRFVGIAATLLMMVTALGWWHIAGRGQIELETMAGERREVTLSDGSAVDLSPSSAVVVRYERDRRLLMLERGQARFHVAKNPNRPFIVQVDRTRVRAVGTVFNVERSGSGVSVTVVGRSRLIWDAGAEFFQPQVAGRHIWIQCCVPQREGRLCAVQGEH